MWNPRAWAADSNARAVANARAATTECGRRRVERHEVALYLASRGSGDDPHIDALPGGRPA